MNVFEYVKGNPVRYVDPDGFTGMEAGVATGFGFSGAGTGAGVALGPVAGGVAVGVGVGVGVYCLFNWEDCEAAYEAFCEAKNDTTIFSKGKGERGKTGGTSGQNTDNPFKHCKPHPSKPGWIVCKDPHTGKKSEKPMPPDFPSSKK